MGLYDSNPTIRWGDILSAVKAVVSGLERIQPFLSNIPPPFCNNINQK